MITSDTIAAIATPEGRGGVGIIRLSGPKAKSILNQLCRTQFSPQSHQLYLKKIYSKTDFLDEGLVVLMQEPNSYTGQDVVEFQCHGNSILLRKVLDACLAAGARIAGPGEFTQRAFLNGKIDLTQAEAVSDLINATSESAHKMALSHLQGELGSSITQCREMLAKAMMLVEAAIDFSHEEHVYQIERDQIEKEIVGVLEMLRPLKEGFDQGRRKREGIKVAILGPPNAGKSTLFNLLLGEKRAIVTDIAGTTRDYLSEELIYEGVAIHIIDTAGLRSTSDQIEAMGVERSRMISTSADVILWLVDANEGSCDIEELKNLSQNAARVAIVVNKVDLDPDFRFESEHPVLYTSLKHQIDPIKDLLRTFATELTAQEGVLLSRTRHLEAVIKALSSCELALQSVREKYDNEIIALDLREALDALGTIVGYVTVDDILNRIFSDFCVGK